MELLVEEVQEHVVMVAASLDLVVLLNAHYLNPVVLIVGRSELVIMEYGVLVQALSRNSQPVPIVGKLIITAGILPTATGLAAAQEVSQQSQPVLSLVTIVGRPVTLGLHLVLPVVVGLAAAQEVSQQSQPVPIVGKLIITAGILPTATGLADAQERGQQSQLVPIVGKQIITYGIPGFVAGQGTVQERGQQGQPVLSLVTIVGRPVTLGLHLVLPVVVGLAAAQEVSQVVDLADSIVSPVNVIPHQPVMAQEKIIIVTIVYVNPLTQTPSVQVAVVVVVAVTNVVVKPEGMLRVWGVPLPRTLVGSELTANIQHIVYKNLAFFLPYSSCYTILKYNSTIAFCTLVIQVCIFYTY